MDFRIHVPTDWYILELHHFLKVDNKTENGWMDGQRTDTHLVDMYGPFM